MFSPTNFHIVPGTWWLLVPGGSCFDGVQHHSECILLALQNCSINVKVHAMAINSCVCAPVYPPPPPPPPSYCCCVGFVWLSKVSLLVVYVELTFHPCVIAIVCTLGECTCRYRDRVLYFYLTILTSVCLCVAICIS